MTPGAAGSLEIKIDGTTMVSATGDLSAAHGGVNRVDVPIHYANPGVQGPIDVIVDDVIVDRAPIPCEPVVSDGVSCPPAADD